MDHWCDGFKFTWDEDRAQENLQRHGISFEMACWALLNRVYIAEEQEEEGEQRMAVISFPRSQDCSSLLFVVCTEREDSQESPPLERPFRRNENVIKRKILPTKDRPMTNISMRMPVDLIETLKKVAPLKEMSGYQSLIQYYIGQGLLNDHDLVSRIEEEENTRLDASDVEAALERIALDKKTIKDFWNAIGKNPPTKGMTGS